MIYIKIIDSSELSMEAMEKNADKKEYTLTDTVLVYKMEAIPFIIFLDAIRFHHLRHATQYSIDGETYHSAEWVAEHHFEAFFPKILKSLGSLLKVLPKQKPEAEPTSKSLAQALYDAGVRSVDCPDDNIILYNEKEDIICDDEDMYDELNKIVAEEEKK